MRGTLAVAAALLVSVAPLRAQAPAEEVPRDLVVRQLSFEGNKALDNATLAAAIVTTNSSWFARAFLIRLLGLGEKRFFNEEEFRRDVVRLQVLYRRSGFPNADIDTTLRREPRDVYITFHIQEGEPITVRSLEMLGVDSLPDVAAAGHQARPPPAGGGPVQSLPDAGLGRLDHPTAQGPGIPRCPGLHRVRGGSAGADRQGGSRGAPRQARGHRRRSRGRDRTGWSPRWCAISSSHGRGAAIRRRS